ncbi:MAG: DUF192 domain-containing protein [Leptolyngbya sp. SIO3F4]|nr:DUF192 domain-containing protein [Leptolyngbya sp. SIO3F4]
MINWHKRRYLPLLGLCCLLLACSTPPAETVSSSPASSVSSPSSTLTKDSAPIEDPSSMLTGPGQVLPIAAQATIAGETFDLEVAQTQQQQRLGLMHRKALPDNRGMLFPFSPARPVGFWMKNVPVGLDMVFLYQGQVQGIAEAPPCEAEPCPTYGPGRLLVDNVIELRIGRSAELGLEPGDRLEIRYLEE